jgi:hypothetical protein
VHDCNTQYCYDTYRECERVGVGQQYLSKHEDIELYMESRIDESAEVVFMGLELGTWRTYLYILDGPSYCITYHHTHGGICSMQSLHVLVKW